MSPSEPAETWTLKSRPEDFHVEEIASYEPSGKGTHLWMRLEKRGLSTRAAVGRLAEALGVQPRAIGYAGQKDARALTRQWLSLEHAPADTAERLVTLLGTEDDLGAERPLVISEITQHKNRLGLGHLHGNRFRVRVRDLEPTTFGAIGARLEELARTGAPNYFGPQRFGHRGDSGKVGGALLAGRPMEALELLLGRVSDLDTGRIRDARAFFDAGDLRSAHKTWPRDYRLERKVLEMLMQDAAPEVVLEKADRRDLDFFLAAHQSELFNALVDRRLAEAGGLGLVEGDLGMRLPIGRKAFVIEDLAVEQERAARLEIAPSGPLYGPKMPWPTGQPYEWELGNLVDHGLNPEDLGPGLPGGRRSLLMRVEETSCSPGADDFGDYLELRFRLSKGNYATSLLAALQR